VSNAFLQMGTWIHADDGLADDGANGTRPGLLRAAFVSGTVAKTPDVSVQPAKYMM